MITQRIILSYLLCLLIISSSPALCLCWRRVRALRSLAVMLAWHRVSLSSHHCPSSWVTSLGLGGTHHLLAPTFSLMTTLVTSCGSSWTPARSGPGANISILTRCHYALLLEHQGRQPEIRKLFEIKSRKYFKLKVQKIVESKAREKSVSWKIVVPLECKNISTNLPFMSNFLDNNRF